MNITNVIASLRRSYLRTIDGTSSVFTMTVDLTDLSAISDLASVNGQRLELRMETTDQLHKSSRIFYLAHRDCWGFVYKLSANNLPNSSLYAFAQSSCPLFSILPEAHRPRQKPIVIAQKSHTDLDSLLDLLSGLPVEIQFTILKSLDQTLVYSLLVAAESYKLVTLINKGNISQTVVDLYPIESISSSSVSIFGQSYISLLKSDSRQQRNLPVKHMKGIRFVIDIYGLRALSIVYSDDSVSSWLGDATGGWKCVLYGRNHFRITRDVRD